jgi:RNA polymerase sigma factor (sigma-70 family)
LFEELARNRKLVKPSDYLKLASALASRLTSRLRDSYRRFYGFRREAATIYLPDECDDLLGARAALDPARLLEAEEEQRLTEEAADNLISMLDDLESLVIRARFIDEMPCDEIATLVGLPVARVYRIIERVVKRHRHRPG